MRKCLIYEDRAKPSGKIRINCLYQIYIKAVRRNCKDTVSGNFYKPKQ